MKKINKTAPLKLIAVLAAFALLLPLLFCMSGAAESDTVSPTEGVFRIRNRATGQYLTAYLNGSRGKDKAYTSSPDSNNTAQIFLLKQREDGSFVIWPQNDSALYCFAYSDSTAAGTPVVKLLTEDERAYFDIFEVRSGACTIAPTGGDNAGAVLGVTDELSYYSDNLVRFTDYIEDDAAQQWYLEPVKTEKMSFAYRTTDVKLYSTGNFYVRLIPYNYIQDRVKWTSDDESILMVGEGGAYTALSPGTVKVTASVDGVSGSFTVTVTEKSAFTWYSQRSTSNSDWDATQLTDLYFRSGGTKLRFAADYRLMSVRSWMREGCATCSVAMVLHNLGATLERGYDFRSGQTGNLPADPYTVALANTYNFGASSASELLYGDPVLVGWGAVTSRFSIDGEKIGIRRVYSPTLRTIADLLESHPAGVVVEFKKASGSHYVVFAECLNPGAASANDLKFIVYDPLGYTPDQGDGVLYERSAALLVGGFGKWSITGAIIIDLADRLY